MTSIPEEVVRDCIKSILSNDFEKAYHFFSFDNQSTIELAEFIKEYIPSAQTQHLIQQLHNRTSFTIGGLRYQEDTAFAEIMVVVPVDVVQFFDFLFYKVHGSITVDSLNTADQKMRYLNAVKGIVKLVKEKRQWRIHGNWQEQIIKQAELSKVRSEYTKNKLKVKSIRIREYKKEQETYLIATLKNIGDKTVRDVAIFIICYSRDNKPCYTVTAHPISEGDAPLYPYRSRKIEVDLTCAPANWSKRVEVKVQSCRFAPR